MASRAIIFKYLKINKENALDAVNRFLVQQIKKEDRGVARPGVERHALLCLST